jgi:hypothetical protein
MPTEFVLLYFKISGYDWDPTQDVLKTATTVNTRPSGRDTANHSPEDGGMANCRDLVSNMLHKMDNETRHTTNYNDFSLSSALLHYDVILFYVAHMGLQFEINKTYAKQNCLNRS